MNQIRLGDIIIDPEYQTRMKLKPGVVSQYSGAMKAGCTFPEMIIESGTNKVVCGFTRTEAYRRVLEPDDMVPAVFKKFPNELKRQLYAIEDNSKHGQPFDAFDKKNLIGRLVRSGAAKKHLKKISVILGWNIDRVEYHYGIATFTKKGVGKADIENANDQRGKDTYVVVDGEAKPAKGGMGHKHGDDVGAKDYDEMLKHHNGWPDATVIDQLLLRIDHNFLNLKSEEVMERLKELYVKLGKII